MREFGIKGRRYFRKGGDNRTHPIHAFQFDKIQKLKDIYYLCQNPEKCKEYGELKRRLADQYSTDIDGYCDDKDEFVITIEKEALKCHWINR